MYEEIDIEKVADWLNEKWKGHKLCPICNNNNWGIGERPVEVREFHSGGLVVGGPVYPLITVTCGVCGYTLLFNAVVTGLVQAGQNDRIPSSTTKESGEDERRTP
jgi:predicted nucleic-acid-binding Zn-ribbon protein